MPTRISTDLVILGCAVILPVVFRLIERRAHDRIARHYWRCLWIAVAAGSASALVDLVPYLLWNRYLAWRWQVVKSGCLTAVLLPLMVWLVLLLLDRGRRSAVENEDGDGDRA